MEDEEQEKGFLGIILMCHSAVRGNQLVFRYPEVVRSRVTQETLRVFGERMEKGNSGGRERKMVPPSRNATMPALSSRRKVQKPFPSSLLKAIPLRFNLNFLKFAQERGGPGNNLLQVALRNRIS